MVFIGDRSNTIHVPGTRQTSAKSALFTADSASQRVFWKFGYHPRASMKLAPEQIRPSARAVSSQGLLIDVPCRARPAHNDGIKAG